MTNYLVHSSDDRKKICRNLGIDNAEELFNFIPEKLLEPDIKMPKGLSEIQLSKKIDRLAAKNNPVSIFSSFLGGGAYSHYIPSVVNHITSISQFYTAYTPYQAEISQGTLQYIFEFQSLICRLTGMDITNASMYDGGSSLAEAVLLSKRVTGKRKVLISRTVNPQFMQTVKTYIQGLDMEVVEVDYKEGITDIDTLSHSIDRDTCSIVIQNPNFFGCFEDVLRAKDIIDSYPDCLYVICTNPLSLALLKPPSEYGADIVVGDAQCFGNPLSLGGPYLGYFSSRQEYLRQIPGRIVGRSTDRDGKDAYVLTYQVREQHIRKTKATSNICSNHSLNALAATVYLSLLGEQGLKDLANICLQKANYFKERLSETTGFRQKFMPKSFNELLISSDIDKDRLLNRLYEEKILGGIKVGGYYPELQDSILVSFTEKNSKDEIDKYINILKKL
jgi:glycine dehydrogenase subunit 1